MYSILKKSFKRELFLCFAVVSFIPLTISCLFLVRILMNKIAKDYERDALLQMDQVEETLVDFVSAMDKIQQNVVKEEIILNGILETDSWARNRAYKELYEATQDYRDYVEFDIYNEQGECLLSTASTTKFRNLPDYWGVLKVARSHPDEMVIRKSFQEWNADEISMQMARSIWVNEECRGFLGAVVTEEGFVKILSGSYDAQNGIALLDNFWEEIYSTRAAKEKSLVQTLRARRMSDGNLWKSTDGMSFFIREIGDSGLFLVMGKDVVFTDDVMQAMFATIVFLALLSTALCLIMASVMSSYLTAPIDRLTRTMQCVESGDLDARVDTMRKDELGQLSRNFDRMTGELKRYMKMQVRQQQEINDSNIAMMHAQLNPHFLYNTLDTMKWVAKANHVPELATMSSSLAKILRMSISDNKFATMAQEMKLVEYYVEIQQLRFADSFNFDMELPMELEDCIVPKLIVQPIVENAIIHGLKERQEGQVFVNVFERDAKLWIEVVDDGCGMDEEMIKLLNSRDREKLKGHIGFYNVDTIIRLYYGEGYGMQARNEETGGTRVTLILPIVRGEENA